MIESLKSKQVKNIISLQKKVKERKKQQLYIIEGKKVIDEIPKGDLVKKYVSETFYQTVDCKKYLNDDFEIVKDMVFQNMCNTKTPQGIIAVVKQKNYHMQDIVEKQKPLIMILEDLQDPGNMGTIIRTAEGAGVDGIIITDNSVDVYNPKVVRSTMGSILRMPIVSCKDIAEALQCLKDNQVKLFAAHLEGQTMYDNESYIKGTGMMIGNESKGLSSLAASYADSLIKIPLKGSVESLNASIAASILMYEVARQRRQ